MTADLLECGSRSSIYSKGQGVRIVRAFTEFVGQSARVIGTEESDRADFLFGKRHHCLRLPPVEKIAHFNVGQVPTAQQ